MPTKTKTPPPMPGENGASRKRRSCDNFTGGSLLAAQRPAWEQLKSLGLIPLDEQYDCMKAVHSFYTNKLKSLNPKPTGSVSELPPPWNLPPLPHALNTTKMESAKITHGHSYVRLSWIAAQRSLNFYWAMQSGQTAKQHHPMPTH